MNNLGKSNFRGESNESFQKKIEQDVQYMDRLDNLTVTKNKKNNWNWFIENIQDQNEILKNKVKKLEAQNFDLQQQDYNIQSYKNKIKLLQQRLSQAESKIRENQSINKQKDISNENQIGNFNVENIKLEQSFSLLKIRAFQSDEDLKIFNCYEKLFLLYKNSESVEKKNFQFMDFSIFQYQQKFFSFFKKSIKNFNVQNFQLFTQKKKIRELENLYKTLKDKQNYGNQNFLKKLFFQFGENFYSFDENQFNKKVEEISNFILKQQNMTFELRKLFSKVLKKQPQKDFTNLDLVKIIQKNLTQNKKKIVDQQNNGNLNQQKSIADRKSVEQLKLKNMILTQENSSLREEFQLFQEEKQLQKNEIQNYQKVQKSLELKIKNLTKKFEESKLKTQQLEQQIKRLTQNENQLQQQNEFFQKKFSIICSVRQEFPSNKLSMISQGFFDEDILPIFENQNSQKIRGSLLLNDISHNMFQEAKKEHQSNNFKDFLLSQIQKPNKNISTHNSQKDDQLNPIEEASSDTLTDSQFDSKKSYENRQKEEEKIQNKQQIEFMKQQIQQLQIQQQQILQKLEKEIQEKQYQELQIQELLKQMELLHKELEEQSQKIKHLKQTIKNLETEKIQFKQENLKNETIIKNLRLQNLEVIKLKAAQQNFFKQQQEKNQSYFQNRNLKNWGTQTQNNKFLEISPDTDIIKQLSSNSQKKQIKPLQKKDSIRLFQQYSLFQQKVKQYKKIINQLSRQQISETFPKQ